MNREIQAVANSLSMVAGKTCCAHRQAGFTLVEMLIAVTVLALSFFAIAPLLTTAVTLDRDTMLKVKVQSLAAYKMDELIAQGLTVTGCDGLAKDCTAAYNCNEFIDPDTDLIYPTLAAVPGTVAFPVTRNMAILPVANTNLCRITITTTYAMRAGENVTHTLIAEKGR